MARMWPRLPNVSCRVNWKHARTRRTWIATQGVNDGRILSIFVSPPNTNTTEKFMIPQAITSSGPYADLWSHLKSMIHALKRASAAENTRDLSPLDRERLTDVSKLLKSELLQSEEKRNPDLALLAAPSPFDPIDTLGV